MRREPAIVLRHPWAQSLMVSSSDDPSGALSRYGGVVATFVEGGSSNNVAHRALHAWGSTILGVVQKPSIASAGQIDGVAEPTRSASFATMMPHLAAMAEAHLHSAHDSTLGWCDSQAELEFTLDPALDGLARLKTTGETRAHVPADH